MILPKAPTFESAMRNVNRQRYERLMPLDAEEINHLQSYNNLKSRLEHFEAHPEEYSTSQMIYMITWQSRFNFEEIANLQWRLNNFGVEPRRYIDGLSGEEEMLALRSGDKRGSTEPF